MAEERKSSLVEFGVNRHHEQQACALMRVLFDEKGRVATQESFVGVERRVDMAGDGNGAAYALPLSMVDRLRDRRVLFEFESSTLTLDRARAMLEGLMHCYSMQTRGFRWSPLVGEPPRVPVMITFTSGLTSELFVYLNETAEEGVFHIIALGLELLVVDTSGVPSDSKHAHLRLMHKPNEKNPERYRRAVEKNILAAVRYADLPEPLLKRYIMTALQHHFRDDQVQKSVYERCIFEELNRERASLREMILALAEARNLQLSEAFRTQLQETKDTNEFSKILLLVGTTEQDSL